MTQTGSTTQAKHVSFQYGEDGRFERIRRYAGSSGSAALAVDTVYDYDGRNRLERLRHAHQGLVFNEYTYTYDTLDRIDTLAFKDGVADYGYDEQAGVAQFARQTGRGRGIGTVVESQQRPQVRCDDRGHIVRSTAGVTSEERASHSADARVRDFKAPRGVRHQASSATADRPKP